MVWVWVLFESCLQVPREDVGVIVGVLWYCYVLFGFVGALLGAVGHIWVLLGAVCVLLVMLGGVWILLGGARVVGVL